MRKRRPTRSVKVEPQYSSVMREPCPDKRQPAAAMDRKTDGVHARYLELETETLHRTIKKLPSIPE